MSIPEGLQQQEQFGLAQRGRTLSRVTNSAPTLRPTRTATLTVDDWGRLLFSSSVSVAVRVGLVCAIRGTDPRVKEPGMRSLCVPLGKTG